MEPEGSLLCSQEPVTFPSSKADQPTPSQPIFLKIHFNVILPSSPRSSKWFLFLRVFRQNPVRISLLVRSCHMSTHLIVLYLIIWVMFGGTFRLSITALCNFLQSPASLSLLGPNVFPSALFPNTLTSYVVHSPTNALFINLVKSFKFTLNTR